MMDTLINFLRNQVSSVIQKIYGLSGEESCADISICSEEKFGHYQCNSALRLTKLIKKNPRVIAQEIVEHLKGSFYEKIEIAGPGFINFTFASSFLSKQLHHQLHDPKLGVVCPKLKKKIIVEFSSPNVAKELHVGHIRSTIIGDCLARLFEFLDQEVLRLNHIGDWGTQFGMLIVYMQESVPDVLAHEKRATLEELMGWYKASKKRFDEDLAFKKRAQLEVVKLQSGDAQALSAWELICSTSRIGFQEIYDLLGVKIIERGESFYNPYLKEVVDDFDAAGLITISDGAKCIYLEGFKNREGEPLPLMIQKSDGGYNYDTTDLAALKHRIFIEKADRIIVITDLGQALHFQMAFAAIDKIGWWDHSKLTLNHVGFGLVLGPDGKKFKTRSGDTEKLIDLLLEAIRQAKAILLERSPEMDPQELNHLAKVLGIGAIKYADLSSSRTKDYTFSYEKMLKFEGNTATFLLYAYVRIQGIKRKVGKDLTLLMQTKAIQLEHPSEISLGVHLRRFGEVLDIITEDLFPNHLTEYLYTLAEKFHAFFRDCRVEGVSEETERLLLCELTGRVLAQGLHILGLETVDRM